MQATDSYTNTIRTSSIDREATAARLMDDVQAIVGQFGARPPGSSSERAAMGYVKAQLHALDVTDLREQVFDAPPSPGLLAALALGAGVLAVRLARNGGGFGKLLGGGILLAVGHTLRQILEGRTPDALKPFGLFAGAFDLPTSLREVLAPHSQNLIARIPASRPARGAVYIVAHLDTSKQRYLLPSVVPSLTHPFNTGLLGIALFGGLSLLWNALTGRPLPAAARAAGAASAGAFGGMIFDEAQPYVEGANGNASGVAVALELARYYAANPLPEHDVIFLFAGAAENLNAGVEAYLDQYVPPQAGSAWIVLESVGIGNPIYVQRGGVSAFTDVRPGAQVTAAAARVSRERPELRVQGRPLLTIDEIGLLRARGYEAIRIAAVDSTGRVPNWNRADDVLTALNPDTLVRTTEYTRALVATLAGE